MFYCKEETKHSKMIKPFLQPRSQAFFAAFPIFKGMKPWERGLPFQEYFNIITTPSDLFSIL